MKKVGIIKRVLAVGLIFLLAINSFAAIVSDNDGSAFITKAEFDSLKNNFQTQIDSYNASIDSKIDGAIAQYLAGIRLATEYQESVCYQSEVPILSVRDERKDLDWREGIIDMRFTTNYVWAKVPNKQLIAANIDMYGNGGANFKECMVDNVDYTNKVALWKGYATTKQKWTASDVDDNENYYSDGILNKVYINVPPISVHNFERDNIDDFNDHVRCQFYLSTDGSSNDNWVGIAKEVANSNRQLSREINYDKNYNCLIFCPKNGTGSRFNNVQLRDFWNDSISEGHTAFKASDHLSSTVMWGYLYAGSGNLIRFDQNLSISNYASPIYKRPYIGMVKGLSSWGMLYTDAYAGFIGDVVNQYPSSSAIYTVGGKNYLWLDAGFPLIKNGKYRKVKIELSFTENTKTFNIWFKKGPFSHNLDPINETSSTMISPTNIKIDGVSQTALPGLGTAVRVNGNVHTFEFDVPKDEFIFIKWSYDDTGAQYAGGGSFNVPSLIRCVDIDT